MKKKQMKNKAKVIIVAIITIAIALSFLAPVFGEDIGERNLLREDIDALRKEVQEIYQDLLSTPQEITMRNYVRGVPSGFSFNNNIRERATGVAVSYLQAVLNTDPTTRVAVSGWGSRGKETSYFGEGTRSAILRFQKKYGLSATGFVGEQTRKKLNEILREGVLVKERNDIELDRIRERVFSAISKMKEINKKITSHKKSEDEKCIEGDAIKDIASAKEYGRAQDFCTEEFREMSCGSITYEAINGCEISFLLKKGWR